MGSDWALPQPHTAPGGPPPPAPPSRGMNRAAILPGGLRSPARLLAGAQAVRRRCQVGRAPRQHRPLPLNIATAPGHGAAGAGGTRQGAGGRMRRAPACAPLTGPAATRAGTGPRSRPVNSAVRAQSRRCFVCRGVWSVRSPSVVHSCGVWRERCNVFSSVCGWGLWGEQYSEFLSEVL